MAVTKREYTTWAALKADLGLATDDLQSVAEGKISAASRLIDRFLGRRLWYDAGIVEKVASYGTTELLVERAPIKAITSIVDGNGQTVSSAAYAIGGKAATSAVENDQGVVQNGVILAVNGTKWIDSTLMLAPGAALPDLPGHEHDAWYTVTYDGGYETPMLSSTGAPALPQHIQDACKIAAWFLLGATRRDASIQSESLLSYSVSYGGVADMIGASGLPLLVEAMLGGERYPAFA